MFNLTAALVPLAKKTLVQKLLPGVEAEGLKICLVMLWAMHIITKLNMIMK